MTFTNEDLEMLKEKYADDYILTVDHKQIRLSSILARLKAAEEVIQMAGAECMDGECKCVDENLIDQWRRTKGEL